MAQTSIHLGRGIFSRDRRAQVRQAVRSLAYVELGDGNGGVALNISEGGMAIQAVMALNADDLGAIRIQLAHAKKQIEARGRVAWTSNLRRLAGVEFVDLSDESRIQIREWISLESSDLRPIESGVRRNDVNDEKISDRKHDERAIGVTASEVLSQAGAAPQKQLRPRVLPATQVPPAFVPGPYQLVGQVSQAPAHISDPASDGSSETARATNQDKADAQTTVNIDSDKVKLSSTLPKRLQIASVTPRGAAEIPEDRYGLNRQRGSSKRAAAVDAENESAQTFIWVCVFTVISLGAGWLAGHGDWRDVAQRMRAAVSTNAAVSRREAQPVLPPNTFEIEIVDANNHHWLIPMNPQGLTGETAPSQPISDTASHRSAIAIPKSTLPAPLDSRPAVNGANAMPPEVKSLPAEPNSLLSMSATGGPGGPVNVPAPRPPVSGQKSTIQPGELIHKVDPAYPKAAIFEKVEGVVKIAAVIGADGNVKTVQPVSGPRALIPAAMDAIRQWRYSPTLLDGQPIETQRQISVTFRLEQMF